VLRQDLWALFRSLADDGATLFVSSHVMDEAMRCDRLILMRDGHLIADTTPPELLRETGTSDADAAFLALIERGDTSHGRHAGSEEGAAS
jgi:ABC-2 type transport system ATP-binding protein